MEKLMVIVCCLMVTANAYKLYNFESSCGKTLILGKDDTPGVVALRYKTINESNNCTLYMSTNDKDLTINIELKGVNFPDCKPGLFEIKGFSSLDNPASPASQVLFSSSPNFCGKKIIYPKPQSVNQGYYNPKVSFFFRENNITEPAYFEFYYSIHPASDGNTTAAPQYSSTSTTSQDVTTASESTSSVDETTTGSPMTSTQMPETTTKMADEATTKIADETTTKVADEATTKMADETTTKMADETTTNMADETTTKMLDETTTSLRVTKTPQEITSPNQPETRVCTCQILVKGYGGVTEERKMDVSYIMSQFVRGSISFSNCNDQYRCTGICNKYMTDYMATGLSTKRRKFGEETVGDYVCTSLGQLVLDNKPALVAFVANARGCPGYSFVSMLSVKFCCVGSNFAFKSESCSKAPASLADPPTTTKFIPTTTLPTTRARPTSARVPAVNAKTRRCKCEMLVQINGEKDEKIDLSYVNYKFIRGSITNSACTDKDRCSTICRRHVDEYMSNGLDSPRNKIGGETAGDYTCFKIGHEVLSNNPAKVTLITSASGCSGHSHVTDLSDQLCCAGQPSTWKAVECRKGSLRSNSIFG